MEKRKFKKDRFTERLDTFNTFINPTLNFRMDLKKNIASLKAISTVVFLFSPLFIAGFIYKLTALNSSMIKHFKLPISRIDALPIFKTSPLNFGFMVGYEILELIIIGFVFWYLLSFLRSIEPENPFKNIRSAKLIRIVARLSLVFFIVNTAANMHFSFYLTLDSVNASIISNFHFEYLLITYFLYVFAILFKRGVDMHSEMDLVI